MDLKSPPTSKHLQNGTGNNVPQYLATFVVSFGAFATGTVVGWTSNISTELLAEKLNSIPIGNEELELITSFMTIGSILMCVFTGPLCDFLGRKFTMLLTTLPLIIGWPLIIFARSIEMLYVGRFFTGISAGAFCVTPPLYITEIAQKEIRGFLGTYYQLFMGLGLFISTLLGTFVSPRMLSVILAVPPYVLMFGLLFLPDTPIYLLQKNKEKAAVKALRRLRGADYNIEPEISEIEQHLKVSLSSKVSAWESLKKTETKKAFVISFGIMFFQQLCGEGAILYYTKLIFETADTSLKSSDATTIVGAVGVLALFLFSFVMDRFGRKTLLIVSSALVAVSMGVLGVYFMLKDRLILSPEEMTKINFVPILALILFTVAFSVGLQPIPGIMATEVFPPEMKGIGSSAANVVSLMVIFLMAQFYLSVAEAIHRDVTFYSFTLVSLLGIVFVMFVCPETKGKSLAVINLELNGNAA